VVAKIERAIVERNRTTADGITLSASLGVHTAGWTDSEQLLLEADRRMYEMKRRRAAAAAASGAA
jgi:GGDEF domain-containing protein